MSDENPKHIQAMKDGKAPLEYLVDFVMTGDAYVHQGGALKYGYRNWTIDKIKASTYIAAIRRHLKAWSEGEDLDPDSGWSHLYHIRAGCAIVLDADNVGTLIDDRDRAESISQEKETDDVETSNYLMRGAREESREEALDQIEQFVVRFTAGLSWSQSVAFSRTWCYGPFANMEQAQKFAKVNRHKVKGVVSIDTILPI